MSLYRGLRVFITRSKLSTSQICTKKWKQTTIRSMQKPNRGDFSETGYILLAIPIATFALGTWQVKRRKWKLNLIDDLEQRMNAQPVPLPEDYSSLKDMEYKKITVRGRFDHTKEVYIGPRSLLSTVSEQGGGLISANRSSFGSQVITPFKLADRNLTILINRGWVPKERLDPRTRPEGQISEEIVLTGAVRNTEKRQQFQPKMTVQNNQYTRRDVEVLANQLDTAPVFLDADFESTVPGGPVGGQTRVSLRNEHFSYIITWYSLSAFTFAMWYRKYWMRRG